MSGTADDRPVFLFDDGQIYFPDPRAEDAPSFLAVGGNLCIERLLLAYENGIFPWYEEGGPVCWWSPDPRAILPREHLHVSRSLRRRLRKRDFELSWNRDFEGVMRACGDVRSEGTWIFDDMLDAYQALHRAGHAHSLEVWREGLLVGGIYGVQRGALFAAESMFYRCRDMSKVALVTCVHSLFRTGIELFDVQFITEHLSSFGAVEISRADYLTQVDRVVELPVDLAALELELPLGGSG